MGVMNYEQNRQYAVRTEVLALVTLVEYGNLEQKHNALKQITVIAYPHVLAEKINKRVEGICCVVGCLNTHKEVEMVESGTGQTIICLDCLERD